MKKLSIRSIFILILVLVLAFALVACGEKDEPKPEPKPEDSVENVQAFFNTLWEKSSSIGNTKVGEKDDLKVDLGLTVKIATQDETGTEYQAIDLGVDLDLVLDRSSAEGSSKHTAIKARLYDPSNNNETWVTLYYFFNDVDNVYVDFAGQNFKVPFDYLNDTFNKNFDNFINNEKIINKDNADKAKSIGEIITAVTENMGASWNLNTLVDDVVKLFGINLKDMIAGNDMIGGIIEGLLGDGATVDDVFDGDRLDINKILANENIARALFLNEETIVDQDGFYSTAIDLNGDIGGMVVGMIPEGVDKIINANTELYLQYQLKNNALDSFGIKAVLTEIESTVGEKTVHPALTVNITDLKFATATTDNGVKLEKDKSNYSTSAVLDASAVLDLAGFSLDATKLDSLNGNRFSQVAGLDNLQLKGQISVGLTGKVDLKDNNGIAAYAHLTYKADDKAAAVKVLEASFVNGNLAVVVNQKANLVALDSTGKTVNVPIASTLVNLWGDYAYNALKDKVFTGNPEVLADLEGKLFSNKDHRTINPNFVGAEWTGIDIVTGFKGVMDGLFTEKPANESADMATIIGNVVKTVEKALPLVSTADNKLAVATDNIGNAVNSIGKVWWGKNAPDFKQSIIDADKSNWLDKFTEAIKIEGATYTTKQDFLKAIFNSSANVVLDMSKNGLTLDLGVNVTKDASVKFALNIGAKASATITDLSAGWKEDANTFVFNISSAPTKGTVNADGTLTLTGIEGSIIDVKIGDGEYFRVEGTWNGNTFTSKTALPKVVAKVLIKARMTAPGTDGPSFGVKMTNNYVAPETDAKK